jgi:hypothetical protein
MAIPPSPGEPDPGHQIPGTWPPAGIPPQTFAPGSWVPYPPPRPGRNDLIFARVMLGVQAGLAALALLITPLAFFVHEPGPPGVTSPYGDVHPPSLSRNVVILLLNVAVAACAATATFRLAPGRPRMWWLALATQATLTIIYVWIFAWMAVAPSPEGMASFAALVVGPVAVSIPVIGLIALLLPSARAAALGRQSRSSLQ